MIENGIWMYLGRVGEGWGLWGLFSYYEKKIFSTTSIKLKRSSSILRTIKVWNLHIYLHGSLMNRFTDLINMLDVYTIIKQYFMPAKTFTPNF